MLLSATVFFTACAGQRSDASDPTGRKITPSAFDAKNVRTDLPIIGLAWRDQMPFAVTDDDNRIIYTLWQQTMAKCMIGRGFKFHPAIYPEAAHQVDRVNPLDRAYAEVLGYHELPVEPGGEQNTDTSPAFDAALEGSAPQQGCGAAGWSQSYGPFEEFFKQLDQAHSSLGNALLGFAQSETGQPFAAAWSACMAADGYSYSVPQDAVLDYVERASVSKQELTTRLTDLDCDVKSGYTVARHNWESLKVESWLSTNEGMVTELTQQRNDFEKKLVEMDAAVSGTS